MTLLTDTYQSIVDKAVKAIHRRDFYAAYPEHPKAYGEEAPKRGQEEFQSLLNKNFDLLLQNKPEGFIGEEVSPYTMEPLGIRYPRFAVEDLIQRSTQAWSTWRKANPDERMNVLVDSLERIKERFFTIAYATMHTTGQSFIMSFQASGPHSNDRALEAIAMGYEELKRFPDEVLWEKPMGKDSSVKVQKFFRAVPKGIGLVIGCSTFPVWNTVPGLYATLITGNTAIVKPHPKSVLPIAIVIAELQQALQAAGFDPHVVQMAVDSSEKLITKQLAEHPAVKLIDYTGSSTFGNYIESLVTHGKTVFTEKAGVNSVILHASENLDATLQNLAFAVSLYSGQMCTAPQNFFIPASGVKSGDKMISYEEVIEKLKQYVQGLALNPKAGPGTLGAIQSEATMHRIEHSVSLGKVILPPGDVKNPEFEKARVKSPVILEASASDRAIYGKELFGPIIVVIKTKDVEESIALAKQMGAEQGAITCAAYTTDEQLGKKIMEEMESVFVPVTLNFHGFIWVNQHAAFSDFHVTGGNPAGNASFTNPEYVIKRFVWVGHRKLIA
ncbi:MAG: oxidoreductase [Chitinophagales bacterium]|nr:MAG: oxidoreductase [Chitinophagales bacterium]